MRKLMALILALLLALPCAPAFAQTVYTRVTVDREQAKMLISGFGMPEAQLSMADPILSLLNALGVRVTSVEDGAQVDLDLNGEDALSLGWTSKGADYAIVSTLFPNHYLTLSNDTLSQMMAQMAQNMPGTGDSGGFDPAAMQNVFGSYYRRWMRACTAAGQPGQPVSVEFQYRDYEFDTMVPVSVDMTAITTATSALLDELLADPAAMGMLRGMAQGMSQGSGAAFNPETFDSDFKAGFKEWMAHFPDEASAEVYTKTGDTSGRFYMNAKSFHEGEADPFFTSYMLYGNAQNMDMGYTMDLTDDKTGETIRMTAGFAMKNSTMKMYFDMGGMYYGLNMRLKSGDMAFDVFFMNADHPLLSVAVQITDGGNRTLSMDAEGRTKMAVEEFMADANSEAAQSLYGDIQANGLSALMSIALQQVPDLSGLLGQAG